jgi:adenine/guanine phosphoribosyltransferase-like PRPP-binding protein
LTSVSKYSQFNSIEGSLNASVQLVRQLEGDIVDCIVLVDLQDIPWKNKVDTKVTTFIKLNSTD